ncbi:hypothetical protein CDAR_368391 [Caerostris darwini]|uniref:Uncharacterized protein n=1 Tax=Caerostris darwini TaxID=1538125 RepID=A0AAV4WFB9_9ARAC|nr:hypothetical protein CDAR_368391 [Caerostris darwini]
MEIGMHCKIINQRESWSHSAEMVIKGSWEQRANQRDRMKNYLYNTAMEIVMNSPCKTCYRDAKRLSFGDVGLVREYEMCASCWDTN